MLNRPASLVTTLRVCSMSALLDASTVTPGSTAPLASVTTPAIACADTNCGRSITSATHNVSEQVQRVIDKHPRRCRKVAKTTTRSSEVKGLYTRAKWSLAHSFCPGDP